MPIRVPGVVPSLDLESREAVARDRRTLEGDELGQAEVEDLDAPVPADEDVLRLQVAVDDPLVVRGGEAVRDLDRVVEGLAHREGRAREADAQALAFEQLRGEVRPAVVVADVEDGEDVGMVEGGHRLRFDLEAPQAVGVRGHGRGEHLEGDIAPEAVIAGAVDLSHASGAEETRDFIGADPGPRGQLHVSTPGNAAILAPAAKPRRRCRGGSRSRSSPFPRCCGTS